jgi:hypothetical protein
MINWNDIQYFKREDFACKCNRHNENNPALPLYAELNYFYICRYFLDPLRKDCRAPIIVTSGGRCIYHNADGGGKKASRHLILKDTGIIKSSPCAVDIYCTKLGANEFDYFIKDNTNIEFCGYHIYKNDNGYFIHIDFRGYKSRW